MKKRHLPSQWRCFKCHGPFIDQTLTATRRKNKFLFSNNIEPPDIPQLRHEPLPRLVQELQRLGVRAPGAWRALAFHVAPPFLLGGCQIFGFSPWAHSSERCKHPRIGDKLEMLAEVLRNARKPAIAGSQGRLTRASREM